MGAALVVGTTFAWPFLRRRFVRWGATDDEVAAPMPGDGLVRRPRLRSTRAVSVGAPCTEVWAWLVQVGQGRGGFYSFDGLENAVGCRIRSADEILPEHQTLRTGDLIRAGVRDSFPCWQVVEVEPPHVLVLQGAGTPAHVEPPPAVEEVPAHGYAASTWQWLLVPVDGGRSTRVLVRQRWTYSPGQALLWRLVEPLTFVMEREMLRGLGARAERVVRTRPDVEEPATPR